MMNDLNYVLNVEKPVRVMMDQTQEELSGHYNMSPDDFERAVFTWVMDKLTSKAAPMWMYAEMARLSAKYDEDQTVEGEAG